MDTPTHALIPVIIYGVMRQETLASGTRSEKLSVLRTALIVCIVGALPDMLDPHVTLEERLKSWTHCLATWFGFSALLGALCLARRRWLSPIFAVGLSLVYFSHIVGDAIAGGVGWSYPFSNGVIGDYYVQPQWWKTADIVCVLGTYLCYRLLPMRAVLRRKRGELEQERALVLEEAGLPPSS